MKLYHFTNLFNLPPILKEGIKLGEVAVSPGHRVNAVNLTTNPNPGSQSWKQHQPTDKTKVRLTLQLPQPDPLLRPWRDFCKERQVDKKLMRLLDPYGQGKFWWLYFGTIPPQVIEAIEVFSASEYRVVAGDELQARVAAIEEERLKFDVNGEFVTLKKGFTSSWLLDGDDLSIESDGGVFQDPPPTMG